MEEIHSPTTTSPPLSSALPSGNGHLGVKARPQAYRSLGRDLIGPHPRYRGIYYASLCPSLASPRAPLGGNDRVVELRTVRPARTPRYPVMANRQNFWRIAIISSGGFESRPRQGLTGPWSRRPDEGRRWVKSVLVLFFARACFEEGPGFPVRLLLRLGVGTYGLPVGLVLHPQRLELVIFGWR